jgi:hypothetical protein
MKEECTSKVDEKLRVRIASACDRHGAVLKWSIITWEIEMAPRDLISSLLRR